MKKQFSLCMALLCMGALTVAAADPLVKNGSFEDKNEKGMPVDWGFSIAGGAKAVMQVTDSTAFVGSNSLSVTNATPRKGNVFATLRQQIALEPNKSYTLSFNAKGEDVKGFGFIIGNSWKTRFYPKVTGEWKEFTYKFKLPASEIKDGKALLMVITEDVTKQLYIDDVDVVADPQ